jgi:hypothetical protein
MNERHVLGLTTGEEVTFVPLIYGPSIMQIW